VVLPKVIGQQDETNGHQCPVDPMLRDPVVKWSYPQNQPTVVGMVDFIDIEFEERGAVHVPE